MSTKNMNFIPNCCECDPKYKESTHYKDHQILKGFMMDLLRSRGGLSIGGQVAFDRVLSILESQYKTLYCEECTKFKDRCECVVVRG